MRSQVLQTLMLRLTSRNDIVLAFFLVMIIFMMVLPMPTLLVDTLIAVNIASAVVLLMVAAYIHSPLAFSAFPAVLLLSTLFRLALSITTTRLILLDADAGQIVYTFGDFVVGGNLLVGLVVFLIITVVQFIVITKGSERVAEVGARFSLDAMPGKQMSIDSDLRAGVITMDQARARRSALEKESQLYGAMDGAMKFVKGDAIAGLLIIIVNILGGISVATLQQGMSAGEAVQVYSVLTVGDGLVAQIPAVFIAITAGIIVTRVTTEESTNLGADIGKQILEQPKALLVGSGFLAAMGLIPGFPTVVFFTLAITVGGIGLALLQQRPKAHEEMLDAFAAADVAAGPVAAGEGVPRSELPSAPLILEIATPARDALPPPSLNAELAQVRQALHRELGVPFPQISLRFEASLERDAYVIYVHEVPVAQGHLGVDKLYIRHSPDELRLLGIPFEEGRAFLPDLEAVWVDAVHGSRLREHGIQVLSAPQILCHHLAYVLRKYAGQFVGVQETHRLLHQLEPGYTELIKEALRAVPLHKIADVLRRLVAEGVSIRDLRGILEGLVEHGQQEEEPAELAEHVRGKLKRHICHRFSDAQGVLAAYLLDPATEDLLRGAVRQTPGGVFLALEPEVSRRLLETIRTQLQGREAPSAGTVKASCVLLTAVDLRRHLRKLIEPDFAELHVLSYQELAPEISVQPMGQIQVATAAS